MSPKKKIILTCCNDCFYLESFITPYYICGHSKFIDELKMLGKTSIDIKILADDILVKEIPDWCPLPNDTQDDSLLDNTDFAHPAFWRGQLSGVHGACKSIESILDGKDDGSGVVNDELLEKLRRRVLEYATKLNEISKQQDVILEQQVEIIRGLE